LIADRRSRSAIADSRFPIPDMPRRALIIGIDAYQSVPSLTGCVADALAMSEVLAVHEDGAPNFDCQVLTSPGAGPAVTRALLRDKWDSLFASFDGDVLFYFAGHGTPTSVGGYLVTQEGTPRDPGLSMDELLVLANRSRAQSVLLILDCCFSGFLGNPQHLQGDGTLQNQAQLREGVTILTAARPTEVSMELDGHGVFTGLVLSALKGGAADVRGRVSAASIYAYVEAALGAWDQRPLYKSYADRLEPVRICEASVPDSVLRQLPKLFPRAEASVTVDPSYEEMQPGANPEHVAVFKTFGRLRNAGLLKTVGGEDLYWAALRNGAVRLTPLGQFYWQLAKRRRI
jgi:Caspase domain